MLWVLYAWAAPVDDAVRIYGDGRIHTCIERRNGEHACWGGDVDRAVPADDFGWTPPPSCRADGDVLVCGDDRFPWPTSIEQIEGSCVLGDGQVHCVGDTWRMTAGYPPGTPADRPLPVPELAGGERLLGPLCILKDGVQHCMANGHLRQTDGLPPLADVQGRLFIGRDGQLFDSRKRPVDVGPVRDAVMSSSNLVRRTDGTLFTWDRGPAIDGVALDLPAASTAGEDTLFVGMDRSCAIVDGKVACWGSDRQNQLGDGGGRALHWGEQHRDLRAGHDEPMACRRTSGKVTCTEGAPWGVLPLPPVELDDVQQLEASSKLGCARHTDGDLTCFGRHSHGRLLPTTPVLTGIVDVSVGKNGIAALDVDGHLHVFVPWKAAFLDIGPATGATSVVSGGEVGCAIGPDTLTCGDYWGPVVVEPPDGRIEARGGVDLCIAGTQKCLEGFFLLSDLTTSMKPSWVEAAW